MNVIEIFAKFVVDTGDLNKSLSEAESKASSFGSGLGSVMGAVGTAAKVAAGAVVGAAGAVGAVASQAQGMYAEYQQLTGGIETLFEDQEAVNAVMANASNAYKTAGMSQNDYMDTVINMAASLNKATGDTVESARLADMAITDMADNVNKMGTSMEAVQDAYRGFTRSNFIMLDNLALGYNGSRKGMEELLADAEKISGIKYDINSYADIVNAIHEVQTNIGITGTTAAEAAETISGSAGAMKAAWDNLILGLADPNADLGVLIDNVVASAKTALANMIPAFTQAIKGIGELVKGIAPVISDELPGLVEEVLPPLLDAASSLLDGVLTALPKLLDSITGQSDIILGAISDILQFIIGAITPLLLGLADIVPDIIDAFLMPLVNEADTLIQGVIDIVTTLVEKIAGMLPTLIPDLMQAVIDIILALTNPDNITALTTAAVALVQGLADGIIGALPKLIDALPKIIEGLVKGIQNALPKLLDAYPKIFEALSRALLDNMDPLMEAVEQILELLIKAIPDLVGMLGEFFTTLYSTMIPILIEAYTQKLPEIVAALVEMIAGLGPYLPEIFDSLMEALGRILNSIIEAFAPITDGLSEKFEAAKTAVSEKLTELWGKITEFFEPLTSLIVPIITSIWNRISAILHLAKALIVAVLKLAYDYVKEKIDGIVAIITFLGDSIYAIYEATLKPFVDDCKFWFDELVELVEKGLDDCIFWFEDMKTQLDGLIGGLIDDALFWGRDLLENFIGGITKNMDIVTKGIDDLASAIEERIHFSEPDVGPLSNFHTYAPDMMKEFAQGIKDNTSVVTGAVNDAFNFGSNITGGGFGMGGAGLITPTAGQGITVVLELDKAQLAKTVFNLNNAETQRMGVRLTNV